MAKNKKNKVKQTKYYTENELEIRRLVIILVTIIVLVIGIYFLSEYIVSSREKEEDTANTAETTSVSIDYDKLTVGTILNRPYDEYYVLVYDSEDVKAVYYDRLIPKYKEKEDAIKIYFCDLNNELNKEYKSKEEAGNKEAKSIEEFSFGKITLLKIKKGKVSSYTEDIEKIKEKLS